MDSTLEDFCRMVLDWHHRHISQHDLQRVAVHLREVVQPQLAELAELKAEKTNAATKKATRSAVPA